MIRRLINLFINPIIQALIVTGIIILFIPLGTRKYRIEMVEMSSHFDQSKFFFADLDQDGYSERIHTFQNDAGNVGAIIRIKDHPDEQWNFRGIYEPKCIRMMLGDYDSDGKDEIFLFTLVNDSIMLQALRLGPLPRPFIHDRYIASLGKSLKDPDYKIIPGKITDMNGDGMGDMVFAINAGFSRTPRNVFIYDINHDTLIKSPNSGAYISKIKLFDIDHDSQEEILLSTYASDNYNEDTVPYHDSSSWMMILTPSLNFMFPPVEFKGITGELDIYAINIGFATYFIGSSCSLVEGRMKRKFFVSNIKEGMIKEINIDRGNPFYSMQLELSPEGKAESKILGYAEKMGVYEIDTSLIFKEISNIRFSLRPPVMIDIDQDRTDEVILLKPDHEKHMITRYNFSNPVDLEIPVQSENPLFSVKLNGKDPPQLSVQGDQRWRLFEYSINPIYTFRFLLYLSVYLVTLGFIILIRKLYSIQLKRRFETEKKIATLQLSAVKAQMEPHFIINVINSIGANIYKEKKDDAYKLVVRFSNMIRSMLSSSTTLTHKLDEELDFVINYLELEKNRFQELFNYSILVEDETDYYRVIPKMVIQLHTENALKHGIMPKGSPGKISVTVREENLYLLITIEDDGVGRKNAGQLNKKSTGKGMLILEQLFATYNKFNKLPIRQDVIDLKDGTGRPSGTLVKIWIPLDFNEKIY